MHKVTLSKFLLPAILLFGAHVFLSLNRHSHGPKFNYHSELWADRAGYFIYLPAAFEYAFDPSAVEPGLDVETGSGFHLDSVPGVVLTKYPCGVALLQAPFYLFGRALRAAVGESYRPFDAIDHMVPDFAGAFYSTVGLLCLFALLRRRHNAFISILSILLIYGASNVFYYAVADPGMSHIYSFFLFSALLWLLDATSKPPIHRTLGRYALVGACAGLILLVRPTGLVFLCLVGSLFLAGLRVRFSGERQHRWTVGLVVLSPIVILLSLQVWYWLYAFGSPLPWSYKGEGFTEWNSPAILHFLLSPHNGLLPYSPVILLVAWGLFVGFRDGSRKEAVFVSLALGLVTYLGSSWWVWHFGCGFGSRTLVEYTAVGVLFIPGALTKIQTAFGRPALIALTCVLVGYTTKLVYSYGDCWFCGDWDWGCFAELVLGPPK